MFFFFFFFNDQLWTIILFKVSPCQCIQQKKKKKRLAFVCGAGSFYIENF